MIFYGKGSVWDKENNCALCRFKNGKYETTNTREINILKKMFKHEDDIIDIPEKDIVDTPKKKARKKK